MADVHKVSLERALIALEGLSVGDAFGDQFFVSESAARAKISERNVPVPPPGFAWAYTDDTNVALSLVASLRRFQKVDQDWVATSFAEHYEHSRGYGVGMYRLLGELRRGKHWTQEAKRLFSNEGSFGNGAAMRAAPVGAYFADDLNLVVEQARQSAEITHAHPEGVAGAIAVAVAAALAWRWRWRQQGQSPDREAFLKAVLEYLPMGEVRLGLELATTLPGTVTIEQAVDQLGNGSEITAQDTVPFALWCAAGYLDNYREALWQTVSGLGDCDTTCAIVGGIVACYTGAEGIPAEWREYREPWADWAFQG